MKQRLVMCSALLPQPKVLIVDEPMVGLDPRGSRLVKDIFMEESRKKTTIFMSTHSLEVAAEVCQEIAIIQAGKIIALGSAAELRRAAGVDGSLESVFLKLTEGRESLMRNLYLLLSPRIQGFRNGLSNATGKGKKKTLIMVLVGLAFWGLMFGLSFRVLKYFQSVEVIGDLLAHHLLGMILMVFFSLLSSATSLRRFQPLPSSDPKLQPRRCTRVFSAARCTVIDIPGW
jgi:hypothetical protein